MRGLAIAILFLIPGFAMAADGLRLGSVEGVYKARHAVGFPIMSPPDDVERGEDILEIVRTSPGEAYVRAHLVFENGHLCSFHGIAKVEGQSLVYGKHAKAWIFAGRGKPLQPVDAECILTLKRDHDRLVFDDKDDVCRNSVCGARGVWRGAAFDLKSRRAIRYMSRLLASREYAEAISERKAKD